MLQASGSGFTWFRVENFRISGKFVSPLFVTQVHSRRIEALGKMLGDLASAELVLASRMDRPMRHELYATGELPRTGAELSNSTHSSPKCPIAENSAPHAWHRVWDLLPSKRDSPKPVRQKVLYMTGQKVQGSAQGTQKLCMET